MANRSVTFKNKTYTHPGIYSAIDSDMTYSKQSTGSKMIAIIGEATGGEPDKVHFFSTPSQAKKVLKSGELLKACQKAFNPVSRTKEGVSLGGADIIACIRSNKATQASKVFYVDSAKTAEISSIISEISDYSTGSLAVSGTYVGKEPKSLVVEIMSDGTVAAEGTSGVTFNYYDIDAPSKYLLAEDASADDTYEIASLGLSLMFTDGVYSIGDTFMFRCIPALKEDQISYAFVSKDYGKSNNSIQVKIEDGENVKGTKKVTVHDTKSGAYEVYDNMGSAFSIKYKGDAKKAVVNVFTDGQGKATRLQTLLTNAENVTAVDIDVELSKANFKTIKKLVEYLQGFADYEVEYEVYCNKTCGVTDLEQPKDSDLLKGASICVTFADLQNKLEANSSFVELTTPNLLYVDFKNSDYFALTGGSEGKTPASWESYFEKLKNYDVYYVVPLTPDDIVLAECYEHVVESSETFGLERRMVAGGEIGETPTRALKVASTLGPRATYIHQSFYDIDENGDKELYPGYVLAAAVAGRFAFLPDGETATHDAFKMDSLEKELDSDVIASLIDGGVVAFESKIPYSIYDTTYIYCVLDITTAQSDDILEVERSVGTIADTINKEIRDDIETLSIGKKIVVGSLTTIRNAIITLLEKKRDIEEVIVDFKDVNVSSEDDIIYIEYAVAPSVPNNFTFITGHFYSEDLMVTDTVE